MIHGAWIVPNKGNRGEMIIDTLTTDSKIENMVIVCKKTTAVLASRCEFYNCSINAVSINTFHDCTFHNCWGSIGGQPLGAKRKLGNRCEDLGMIEEL